MRLRGPIVLMALWAALGAPNAAPAARTLLAPCGANGLQCATVNVPLDRSGATPGTVSLQVEELPAPGIPRGVLFLIAGGPGQASAGAFTLGANALDLRSEYPGYTLVAFDPRGTGRSGLLRCPELQSDPAASPARLQALVPTCAGEIGQTRVFYSTRDHADDIDAVRQALGVDKVGLWGTSYGTQLSVAYALTYSTHVERLLLHSVADPAGRDPLAAGLLREMPQGLAAICRGPGRGRPGASARRRAPPRSAAPPPPPGRPARPRRRLGPGHGSRRGVSPLAAAAGRSARRDRPAPGRAGARAFWQPCPARSDG